MLNIRNLLLVTSAVLFLFISSTAFAGGPRVREKGRVKSVLTMGYTFNLHFSPAPDSIEQMRNTVFVVGADRRVCPLLLFHQRSWADTPVCPYDPRHFW